MDNQHKLIKGYRDLNEDEIAAINDVKELGDQIGSVIADVIEDPAVNTDEEWLREATTTLKTGVMLLVRAIAQPGGF